MKKLTPKHRELVARTDAIVQCRNEAILTSFKLCNIKHKSKSVLLPHLIKIMLGTGHFFLQISYRVYIIQVFEPCGRFHGNVCISNPIWAINHPALWWCQNVSTERESIITTFSTATKCGAQKARRKCRPRAKRRPWMPKTEHINNEK